MINWPTLLISIFGGFPGIINIVKWVREKPKFGFTRDVIANGTFTQQEHEFLYIMVNGAIYNLGNKTLFPMFFGLDVTLADHEMKAAAVPLVDEFFRISTTQKGPFASNKPIDLMSITKLEAQSIIFGSLVFAFPKGAFDPREVHRYAITCIDIKNKRRSVPFDPGGQMGIDYYNPKYDFRIVKPK